MISVNFPIYLGQQDSLVLARDAIFEAMFERAADLLEQDVHTDRDHDFMDVHVDDLNIELASQFLDLLDQVNLLAHITVDVSTADELAALAKYTSKVAIELIEG